MKLVIKMQEFSHEGAQHACPAEFPLGLENGFAVLSDKTLRNSLRPYISNVDVFRPRINAAELGESILI